MLTWFYNKAFSTIMNNKIANFMKMNNFKLKISILIDFNETIQWFVVVLTSYMRNQADDELFVFQ